MVHVDINPVEVSWNWKTETEQVSKTSKRRVDVSYAQPYVIVFGTVVWEGEWIRDMYGRDEYLEREWRDKWELFLAESFRTWIQQSAQPVE